MNVDLLENYPELPVGWHNLFECMCKEMFEYTRAHRYPEVKIFVAKEKYGGMRVVVDSEAYSDSETDRIIKKWCEISQDVCCNCGELNVKHTKGYIAPICKTCWKKKLHRIPDLYAEQTQEPAGMVAKYPKEFEQLREKRKGKQ